MSGMLTERLHDLLRPLDRLRTFGIGLKNMHLALVGLGFGLAAGLGLGVQAHPHDLGLDVVRVPGHGQER